MDFGNEVDERTNERKGVTNNCEICGQSLLDSFRFRTLDCKVLLFHGFHGMIYFITKWKNSFKESIFWELAYCRSVIEGLHNFCEDNLRLNLMHETWSMGGFPALVRNWKGKNSLQDTSEHMSDVLTFTGSCDSFEEEFLFMTSLAPADEWIPGAAGFSGHLSNGYEKGLICTCC